MTLCAAGSIKQQLSEHKLSKHKPTTHVTNSGTRFYLSHNFASSSIEDQSCRPAQWRYKRSIHIRSFLEQSVSPGRLDKNKPSLSSNFGGAIKKGNISTTDSWHIPTSISASTIPASSDSNFSNSSGNSNVSSDGISASNFSSNNISASSDNNSISEPVSDSISKSPSSDKADISSCAISSDSIIEASKAAGLSSHNISADISSSNSLVELPAARQIVALVTAWDNLKEKLAPDILKCKGSQLLLAALKVAIPAFQRVPFAEDGRFQLPRALEVAYTLADIRMDAEVIAAGILRVAIDGGSISISDVEQQLGTDTLHLLHDCMRANKMPSRLDSLDDPHSSILRQFSLAFHDVRALTVELAIRLDTMRHIRALPKHRQQSLALENMQVYAPLAHALGFGSLSQELEDMAFEILFPDSYRYVEDWLQCHWGDGEAIISEQAKHLTEALMADNELRNLTESVKVTGRCKSRFSTMKKLLKDGRRPDQVYDILGLRVILSPKFGKKNEAAGIQACYRARCIITRMWKEVPGRMKDYISKPKNNGYESLHLAVYLTNYGPWSLPMELQIRTAAMHAHAVAGNASHALYKGGLTDPQQVQHFKTVMLAAANASAYRLQNAVCSGDHIFDMFDENKDGVISREEFEKVIVELGAEKADAYEMVGLVDSNADGSVDVKELGELQRQIRALPAGVDTNKYSRGINKNETRLELKVF